MKKKLLFLILLTLGSFTYSQFTCPTLNGPFNGDIDVPVDSSITWELVQGVPSYLISLGTTPGGTDIIDNQTVGSNSYTPVLGLPDDSDIYVTITLFFFNAENITCPSELFHTEDVVTPPLCTTLASPLDGATDVSTETEIRWNHTSTATGYRLSLGTQEGGNDLLDNFLVENALSYEPTFQLPFETEIFVTITAFNENGPAIGICEINSFTTEAAIMRPACTALTSPAQDEVNVPLSPILEWPEVQGADGYRISIGTAPNLNNIVENGAYPTNSTEVFDFLPRTTYYVTITPFNRAGNAIGCQRVSFTTLLGCGPIEDSLSGEIVYYSPEIDFPKEVSLCLGEVPTEITSQNEADGHRWYKINDDGSEILIANTIELKLMEQGQYRYEAFNLITQFGDTFECAQSVVFSVGSSEIATITTLDYFNESNGTLRITTNVAGIGDYEYAIDSIEGPYQMSNVFENVPEGPHVIYVRDKKGCGIAQMSLLKDLTLESFPKFFTPNGDGINDYWQFKPMVDEGELNVGPINIFDRYGVLIKQIDPLTPGWDGKINGKPMPSSDYWFSTVSLVSQKKVKGHFTLKR